MKCFFNCISELMLATLIKRFDKKSFHFDPVQEQETNGKFYRLSDVTFYDCINPSPAEPGHVLPLQTV